MEIYITERFKLLNDQARVSAFEFLMRMCSLHPKLITAFVVEILSQITVTFTKQDTTVK